MAFKQARYKRFEGSEGQLNQGDKYRKWKKQQQILAASRRKVMEKIRASGHETRDIYLKFNRGESGVFVLEIL